MRNGSPFLLYSEILKHFLGVKHLEISQEATVCSVGVKNIRSFSKKLIESRKLPNSSTTLVVMRNGSSFLLYSEVPKQVPTVKHLEISQEAIVCFLEMKNIGSL